MYGGIDFKLIASYKHVTDIPTLQSIIKMLITYSKKLEIKLIIQKDSHFSKQLSTEGQGENKDTSLSRDLLKNSFIHPSRSVTPNKNKSTTSKFPFGKDFEDYIERVKNEKVDNRKRSPINHGLSQTYSFNLKCKENKQQLQVISSSAKSKVKGTIKTTRNSLSLNNMLKFHSNVRSRNNSTRIGLTKHLTQSVCYKIATKEVMNLSTTDRREKSKRRAEENNKSTFRKKETPRNGTILLHKPHSKRNENKSSSVITNKTKCLKKEMSYSKMKRK